MRRTAVWLTVTASVLSSALAACSTATTSASGPSTAQDTTQAAAPATKAPASTAAATQAATRATATGSAVPTTLDPCQVVTAAEASALAGATFGAAREEASGTDGKRCVYGSQTTNVFEVIVGQAASTSEADSVWSQEESQLKSAFNKQLPAGVAISLHTQDVPGLADRAATITGSVSIAGRTIGAGAIYLLKGATLVAFSDEQLGTHTPSAAAMEAEARTALARVP